MRSFFSANGSGSLTASAGCAPLPSAMTSIGVSLTCSRSFNRGIEEFGVESAMALRSGMVRLPAVALAKDGASSISASRISCGLSVGFSTKSLHPGRISSLRLSSSSGHSVEYTSATSFTFPAIASLSGCSAAALAASAVNLLKHTFERSLYSPTNAATDRGTLLAGCTACTGATGCRGAIVSDCITGFG
jgi:hypothetical protein